MRIKRGLSPFTELIRLASESALSNLDNKNVPGYPNISEPEEAEVRGFLDILMILIGSIGITSFEKSEEVDWSSEDEGVFSYNVKSASAKLVLSGSSYVVLKGSTACAEYTSSAANWIKNIRDKLLDTGVLKISSSTGLLEFTKDTPFTSPSAAAAVINAGNVNGLTAWKLNNGKNLKVLEASAS